MMSALEERHLQDIEPYFVRMPTEYREENPHWSRAQLAGRFCELSSFPGNALLTAAFRLVLDAQIEGEPVAWSTATPDTFFVPDAADSGVDLDALVVIRAPNTKAAACAAERVLRSGGFGLVVMDLHIDSKISVPRQVRLARQARDHHSVLLCLTVKSREEPSVGPMVSLRGQISFRRLEVDRFQYEIEILKDRNYGPGWRHTEICRGPDGLH